MASIYYDVVKDFRSSNSASYNWERVWKVEKIAGYLKANGYIVQKIVFDSNIAGSSDDYYEAWLVVDGQCEKTDDNYDDHFTFDDLFFDAEFYKDNPTGYFKYKAELYWVDAKSDFYKMVEKWKKGNVIMAGNLQATYVADCDIKFELPLETTEYEHSYNAN